MSGARAGLAVRLRLWAIGRIRRSRFLPTGMPDKRVDVAALERPLDAEVVVFHATGQDTLYQLLPWLPAFRALAATHPVTIVFRDSRTAAAVRTALADAGDDGSVRCLTLATYGQLDGILSRTNASELVTYWYRFGSGKIIYSTIPLDFYLGGTFPPAMSTTYAPNVIAFANDLRALP